MKKITFKTALITLLMIVACMAITNVKAQSTCATAISFTPSDTFKETTYNITDSIYWLKFVADSNIVLKIVPPNETPQASILHIYLYSGTCSSLTLLASKGVNDSLLIARGSLSTGSTYYVKVNRTTTTSAYFGLGFQYTKKSVSAGLSCPSITCNLVGNGGVETCNFPFTSYWDQFSPFYPSWDTCSPPDTMNDVCGWRRAWGTPQIYPYTAHVNHIAGMWGLYNGGAPQGEGIMQKINITANAYTLNFKYEVPPSGSAMDSLIVCLTTTNLIPTDMNYGDPIPYYSAWPSSTRDIIYSAVNVPTSTTWQQVSVPFTTTSAYPYIVFYPSQRHHNTTWFYLDSVSIVPGQQPAVPIIAGQWDLCHGSASNPTTSDTIKNWASGCTYYWNIGKNGTQHQFTSSPFTVNWTGHANGGMLYVEVTNGCYSAVDSFKVFACCDKGYPNTNIFADTTFSSNTTINTTHYINGQIIINANDTLGGKPGSPLCYFQMGPNAKIIINPGKTLTINHRSILEAYCDTMWDGIYISDNTAKLILKDTSTVKDAKNAIVSNNGGNFQLSNSDTLRNNYKNVVVNAYTGTHPGKISQTTFTCNATLLPQYPPVSAVSSRTYEGVEINGVNAIYIGDTTAYSKRNTFNNLDYGINASCSQIYVYNNKFLNINKLFLSLSPGTAIYAFGASSCEDITTVGGQNASGYYRSNYFNNCCNGIYFTSSVGGYIKAEYDTLVMQTNANTYPTGIYAYTNSQSNITVCNNKITNGGLGYGIDCQNFGANSSVNISSNYIKNALTGIATQCVNLTTPYTFQIAKNIINCPTELNNQKGILVTNVQGSTTGGATPFAFLSLNRVTYNTPTLTDSTWGIRVQNSSLAHIEQCSVINTSTTLATDSTKAKLFNGIQVELSANSYLCEDTAIKTGCGLRFFGSMPASMIQVNYMDSTYYGVRLDGANVGNQEQTITIMHHTTTCSYGNQWYYIQSGYRLHGTWTPVLWYGYALPSLELLPLTTYVHLTPFPPTGYIIDANLYLSSCSTIVPQTLLSNTVQDIVNNQYNYTVNVAENKYTDNTTAYTILKDDPGILNSMADTNIKYQTFFNNIAASNIGRFEKVNSLILAGDYGNAQLLNSGINPTNIMEINRKTVNDIYLNSWAAGRFNLTNVEFNTLYGIAAQQPIFGGSGVYSARVMVGEPKANSSSARTMGGNDNITTPKSTIAGLIYPDPVTGEANIDYTIKSGNNVILTIFGLTGNKMAEYALNKNEIHFSFSTKEFKPGIYFYQLRVDGSAIEQNKFIIIN